MSNTETIKRQLLDNVRDLILNHNVTHTEIINNIHDEVMEMSKTLPHFQVLYNNAYGGFGVSKGFLQYIRQHNHDDNVEDLYSKSFRINAVNYIVPFGAEILTQYPLLKDVIVLYHHYNLNKVVYDICSMYYEDDKLQRLYKRKDQIESILNTPYSHGHKTDRVDTFNFNSESDSESDDVDHTHITNTYSVHDLIHYKFAILVGYTKETYEKVITQINKEVDESVSRRDNYYKKCLSNENITDTIFDDIKEVVYEIKANEDKFNYCTNKKYDYCFHDALKKFGFDDFRIWECQDTYSKLAMQYLSIKSKDYIEKVSDGQKVYDFVISHDYFEIPEDEYNNIIKDFGLECASSRYCSLKIAEVPQFVSWYVGEYDGLEQINYK